MLYFPQRQTVEYGRWAMAEQRHADDGSHAQGSTAVKRRGILAAAGAVVAGIAMKQLAEPVGAATGGTTGTALILGANALIPGGSTDNTANQTTRLINTNGPPMSIGSYYSGDAFVAAASEGGTGVTG